MDDSVSSQHALEWLESTLLRNGDEVHIVVVALPVPYPVSAGSCHMPFSWWHRYGGKALPTGC